MSIVTNASNIAAACFSQLLQLEALWFDKNQITDITPLKALTQLTHLGLAKNQIRDIRTIESLKNLEHLHIKDNPIGDMKPVIRLKKELPNLDVDIEVED